MSRTTKTGAIVQRFAWACAALVYCTGAQALQVSRVTPQGEVAQVRQVVVRFDAAAVAFGDPRAAAPATVSCSDAQAARGTGRWTGDREWVYDFEGDLPPGVRCTVATRPGYASPQGAALPAASYRFQTGGPAVRNLRPGSWQRIDEEQFFVMQLTGAATRDSLTANVWCAMEGLGERIPVRMIDGAPRDELLKSLGLDKAASADPQRFATFACNRRLTPSAKVQIVFGRGVATPSGVVNTVEKRFDYQVREPFAAQFACERESAEAACLPIRPMTLAFNAPVPRSLAAAIVLRSPAGTVRAQLQDSHDDESLVNDVRFAAPLPENTRFTIELPANFKDASGRALRNAANFPLPVATGTLPPLAKFAAAPFGIVERLAEPDGVAVLPVTLRNVEGALPAQALEPGRVRDLQPTGDAEIIAWQRRLARYDDFLVSRQQARSEVQGPLPAPGNEEEKEWVQSRMVSLLTGKAGTRTLDMPKPVRGDPRPFEVVGIPVAPGFHVVEIASQRLGGALLDARHGAQRTMYVRTSVLVTNLGVHFKLGRENAVAWVTTLDKGQPVAGATVRVSSCAGKELASGTTDARGVALLSGLSPQAPVCQAEGDYRDAYFVSARAAGRGADGRPVQDLAFTWSDWHKGIEPWRFNLPTDTSAAPQARAHTIFDRTLLRAGETVSMKHLMRTETRRGFGLPAREPVELEITHLGSGQRYTQPVKWRTTATGGRSAENEFAIPAAARLGLYRVTLRGNDQTYESGEFRVEEFRLPVFEGRIAPTASEALIDARAVPTGVQVSYVSGGGAANLPVRVSALVRAKRVDFGDHDAFSFNPPRAAAAETGTEGEEEASASRDERVVADKLPLTLDRNGAGRVTIENVPAGAQPRELVLEATYADPNGEVQTLRSVSTLWPAGVVAGIRAESWVSAGRRLKFQALALDLAGKPREGVPLSVKAVARITTTSRKRMVGGFYSYDNKTETRDLGEVCSGRSDSRGLLLCETALSQAGEVELVATARDSGGRASTAASSVWVTRQGELWFGGENNDRIDVLPEKKNYEPGETARFQVRMPFRFATALVAIEREGVIDTQVVQLNGQDPTVSLQVKEEWGPNVYVSVLALRGRLREVPWYSFFTWGYKAPREWWTAFWYEGREYVAPTALVDLSKPAFRLGVAEIRVGARAHRLDVSVKTDRDTYTVRGQARVTVSARLPDGKPAAGAEVALAAVDQALLELMPNTSWNLLESMLQRRSWGVETSTAQMEIIGRRHYGRKAVAPGGGGGRSNTRELLDTLLLWNPRVVLDANGQAQLTVPLNDALTTFRIVAVADASTGLFGTGQASVRTTQDLQIINGLPPLVREDDEYRAQFTLRNTTARAMKVEVTPRATLLELATQTVEIPPNESREVAWTVKAPAQLAQSRAEAILWELQARDTAGGARDALKASQRIVPAVPLAVQQATLAQIDGAFSIDVAPPPGAIAGRGGLRMALQPRLSEGLPGVRDWFHNYPFVCLEQKTSKAIGLRDARLWSAVVAQMPGYLDADGLASFFPPREGDASRGSDTLTAYVLAAAHEAAGLDAGFALPDAVREPMTRGLIAFVEGRIQRDFWSPRKDLDMRKIAAIEALSRYGLAQPRMLQSVTLAPNQWPTHTVIDWLDILRRMADVPQRAERLAEAQQILRARLSYQGTKLIFSTEQSDYWWWLMRSGDVNTARLLLAVMDDAGWKDDMGRLAGGFIARQQGGAWHTTTANLWGGLALEKFSRAFESAPVTGITRAQLAQAGAGAGAAVDWARVERVKPADAAGAAHQGSAFGAPAAAGQLRGNTLFLPWSGAARDTLTVTQQGSGKPWLTLQSLAAVPLAAPFSAGYQVGKTITPVEQAQAGRYTRGDVLRVTLEINAQADMTWVAVTDPIPAGATILGSGLGRDSQIATSGEKRPAGAAWPAFEERSFEAFRGYYEYLPKGRVKMEYTMRLNNVGDFALPPTRAEAMYAPEMFGESPNPRLRVEAAR